MLKGSGIYFLIYFPDVVQKKLVATTAFPGEHRGTRGCPQEFLLHHIKSHWQTVACVYRLHNPVWRSWWGLTMAGCDPDELSYFRMKNICLPESRTCSAGSSWKKRMMLQDVWRLGICQVQDPAEQGLKESSSALCIPGPKWRHQMLSK